MNNTPYFDRIASKLSKISSLFFIRKCTVCKNALWKNDTFLCADCMKLLNGAQRAKCPVCGKRAASCVCRPIFMTDTGRAGEKYISALMFYGKPDSTDEKDIAVRRIINNLKKSPDRSCVKYLASDMARIILRKLITGNEKTKNWVLCFPPRTKPRIREYGFDHSRQLILKISEYTGIPFEDCIINNGSTLQKTLSVTKRRKNAERSYSLRDGYSAAGKKYLIFDDIITTGATVSSCAKLLYDSGAETVFPVCIARTKPKKRKLKHRRTENLWFRQ